MDKGLHIIVLIKQVPDIERVKFNVEEGRIDRSSAPLETNPFDLNALETAIQLKERIGGWVTVISMGPPQAESSLRDALARGADRAILLTDKLFAGADTLATSYTLATAIRKVGSFDLIICGEKTVDGDTGQVGPEVAEHLNIPHVAYVCEIRSATLDRLLLVSDIGDRYLIEVKLPALITVTKDINTPRLPTLRNVLKAKKANIEVWNADSLSGYGELCRFGLQGSMTTVFKIVFPSEDLRKGLIFYGDDAVEKLVKALHERGFLRLESNS